MPPTVSLKFSHIGVAVSNLERAVTAYRDIFGYAVLSGPFEDPIQKVSVCFMGTGELGDLTIELVAPTGEHSPVSTVLAKGIGAYHSCYEVENMDDALAHVRAKGCLIISQPIPAVAFAGRRIAWFYTPARQLVEIVER